MLIGHFTRHPNGGFLGRIETLTQYCARMRIIPIAKKSRCDPDFEITRESPAFPEVCGWAWKHRLTNREPILSVLIDDPFLAQPIEARLHRSDDGDFELHWLGRRRSRPWPF